MNRILVADDEPAIRTLIRRKLEEQDFHVTEAEDGEQAFEKLKTESFDVLVTDRNMGPGMDGIELAKIAYTIQPNLRIILFTSNFKGLSENDRPKYLHRMVHKPIGLGCLSETIRELLSAKV